MSLEHRNPALRRGYHPVLQPDFIPAEIKSKAAINIDIIGKWTSEHKSWRSTQVFKKCGFKWKLFLHIPPCSWNTAAYPGENSLNSVRARQEVKLLGNKKYKKNQRFQPHRLLL